METAYLCPPGDGVFTGSENQFSEVFALKTVQAQTQALQRLLYGEDATTVWQKSLQQLAHHSGGVLVGISSDCGGGIFGGANWGPLFIRTELYQARPWPAVFDLGDVRVIPHLLMDHSLSPEVLEQCRQALYQTTHSTLPVSPLSIAMEMAQEFYQKFDDKGLIGLGGDHSVSFPLARALLRQRKAQGCPVALIHFDARPDLLGNPLGIDICAGNWAHHILSDLPAPDHLYQIGIRSSAHSQAHWESTLGVQQFWAPEVTGLGPEAIADIVVQDLKAKAIEQLYVSFDINAIDSTYASATPTPEPKGLRPHQVMMILEHLNHYFPIVAADMVGVAPLLGHSDDFRTVEPEATLSVAKNLVQFFMAAINRAHQSCP